MRSAIFVFAALAVSVAGQNAQVDAAAKAVNDAKIVPDVVPTFKPTGVLDVTFTDEKGQQVKVTPGARLTKSQVGTAPQVFLSSDVATFTEQTYLLAVVDPDAPTPQDRSVSEVRHWLISDLKAEGASPAQLKGTVKELSQYAKPNPPEGSDPHRYVWLLYVQPTDGDFTTKVKDVLQPGMPITKFDISAFAEQFGLGDPVAATYYLLGPGDAVPPANSTTPPGAKPPTNSNTTTPPPAAPGSAIQSRIGVAAALGAVVALGAMIL